MRHGMFTRLVETHILKINRACSSNPLSSENYGILTRNPLNRRLLFTYVSERISIERSYSNENNHRSMQNKWLVLFLEDFWAILFCQVSWRSKQFGAYNWKQVYPIHKVWLPLALFATAHIKITLAIFKACIETLETAMSSFDFITSLKRMEL